MMFDYGRSRQTLKADKHYYHYGTAFPLDGLDTGEFPGSHLDYDKLYLGAAVNLERYCHSTTVSVRDKAGK